MLGRPGLTDFAMKKVWLRNVEVKVSVNVEKLVLYLLLGVGAILRF